MKLGAHISTAGGVSNCFERAEEFECQCIQIFTKNNNQWKAKPLAPDEVERFAEEWKRTKVESVIAHASYLINLASPDQTQWTKSVDGLIVELERCATLKIPALVLHPGSPVDSPVKAGMERIVMALDQAHEKTGNIDVKVLLETTAGQGNTIGRTFEELQQLIENTADSSRLGVCIDTCHLFAAGLDFRTEEKLEELLDHLELTIELDRLHAVHLNDSANPFGSNKDKHASIGDGEIGLEPFGWIVNNRRLKNIPMCLETPMDNYAQDFERVRGLVA